MWKFSIVSSWYLAVHCHCIEINGCYWETMKFRYRLRSQLDYKSPVRFPVDGIKPNKIKKLVA